MQTGLTLKLKIFQLFFLLKNFQCMLIVIFTHEEEKNYFKGKNDINYFIIVNIFDSYLP